MNSKEVSSIYNLIKETEKLRDLIWGADIPSATISEYKNLHIVFKSFMDYIDEEIFPLFCKFCSYCGENCERNTRCFQNSWFCISDESNKEMNIDVFIEKYYSNIKDLRLMILNKDVIPGDNPNLKDHHNGCVSFMNYITLNIIPLVESIRKEEK